jgi:hypothetical protein
MRSLPVKTTGQFSSLREHGREVTRTDPFFCEEKSNLGTLVALELDHTTQLFVLNQSAVASEFLLESLQELLRVILHRPRARRQRRLCNRHTADKSHL